MVGALVSSALNLHPLNASLLMEYHSTRSSCGLLQHTGAHGPLILFLGGLVPAPKLGIETQKSASAGSGEFSIPKRDLELRENRGF